MARVTGKAALVTGGASGLGEASARLLVREGAMVAIADINREAGEALASELGEQCFFLELDVREEGAWIAAVDRGRSPTAACLVAAIVPKVNRTFDSLKGTIRRNEYQMHRNYEFRRPGRRPRL